MPPDPASHPLSSKGLPPRRLIIGISGATGAIYGVRLLQVLKSAPDIESHLVMSKAAERTIAYETEFTIPQIRAMADASYIIADIGATISSGSFQTEGMIIAPCSIRTLSAIAAGIADNLLVRAADVHLKERRRGDETPGVRQRLMV